MEKESLYIFKLDTQGEKVKFPNADMPAKLGEYTYSSQRMAGTPTLTATLNYPVCLDDEWTKEEFVEFRGERYYVEQVPTSSKDNKSIMYKHELQFVSERIILENVYFMDVVTAGSDTYHSNSTSIKFMGDIHEFVSRLNSSMIKSGIGYSVVIDDNITSESKLVSLDNVYIAEALQSIYTIYELPYYFVGKVCHIGYTEHIISTPLEYMKGLVSIKKTNASYKIVNRVTGVGGSENIPFYYPNVDENGTIERCQNLMPSIYRESGGAERFYNALNDTYKIPDTNDYYSFKNQYTPNSVKEINVDFSDIVPTIEGVTNTSGQLFGEIADVAFDDNDSDEFGTGTENNIFNETDEYVHSYFYIKLHVYNGNYGFNLFEQGLEGDKAVINMTTGNCAACEFEIEVTYKEDEPKRSFNPVLVDSSGNLLPGDFEQKVTSQTSKYVERQQNTSKNEVWIAVKKDNTSFGVVMPNATNHYKPAIGDKFVITGIKMPNVYVIAAEKRLDEALIKYMSENNDEKFTFSVNFSRVFLAENSQLADILNENARMYIKYNNREYLMYVNSFTCKADKNCLYDISVELTDKLSSNVSALRSTITEIAGDIIGSKLSNYGNIDVVAKVAKYFLRKDKEDIAREIINFLKGILLGNFQSGVLGSGGCFSIDPETGESYIEADRMLIRKTATFIELLIQRLKHIGGQLIITPASCVISEVKEHAIEQVTDEEGNVTEVDNGIPEDVYRCYFETTDGNTTIYNEFEVGDQARCQTFNIKEGVNTNARNRYWWRLVTGIGEDYIDISKTDCDKNSDIPAVGDHVSQLGNRADKTRQNAQIISAYGDDSPSWKMYNGIDSYSLEGKSTTWFSAKGNQITGTLKLVSGETVEEAIAKASPIRIDLTNENSSVACKSDGTVVGTLPTSGVHVYNGTKEETDWSYNIAYDGCTGNLANGVITITSLTKDTATATVSASKSVNPILTAVMTISKVRAGKDGTDGGNGIGVRNTDVLFAKSNSPTVPPTTGWSTSSPTWESGIYIWTKTQVVYTDDSVYTSNPACITGNVGASGDDGVGVSSIVEEYYKSTSYSSLEGGSWVKTNPGWENGKYIWTRSTITYTNGRTSTTNPICVTGGKGQDGTGISSVDVEYYKSTSPTSIEGGSWVTVNPGWEKGKYIWSRTKVVYTNTSSYTSPPVCISGGDGQDGDKGIGISGIKEQYYKSTSPTALSGGSWVDIYPGWENGKYIWTRSIITYSDGSNSTTDPICATGGKGENGQDAVIYELWPSVNVVKLKKDGTFDPTSITCSATKTVGNGTPTAATGVTIKYKASNSATEQNYTGAITISSLWVWIEFILYQGSTVLDRERVPIVSDAQVSDIENSVDNAVNSLKIGKYNILRNSGFTGDYVTSALNVDLSLIESSDLFSDPLSHWTAVSATSIESAESESGCAAKLQSGSLSQSLYYKQIEGESYVVSFKAKGANVVITCGGLTKTWNLTTNYQSFHEKYISTGGDTFKISGTCEICEVQLERGTVASAWGQSFLDNQTNLARFESLVYLSDAMKNASTVFNGGLMLTSVILLGTWQDGDMKECTAGISGAYNNYHSVAYWAGGDYEKAVATSNFYKEDPTRVPTDAELASQANYVVTHGGRVILNDAIVRGTIYADSGIFNGVFSGEVKADSGYLKNLTLSGALKSSDYKQPSTIFYDAEGTLLSNGALLVCGTGNGVLPPSSGQLQTACITAIGEHAGIGALYLKAECTNAYGSFSKITALEISAKNDYSGTPAHKPLAIKVTDGAMDVPGVLCGGSVTGGSMQYSYGINRAGSKPWSVSRDGQLYLITHNVGHTRYVPIITPWGSRAGWNKVHPIIMGIYANYFAVAFVDSGTENRWVDFDFCFAMIGDNY